MKRIWRIAAAGLLLVLAIPAFATPTTESGEAMEFPRFIEIGTAGTGGAYYPIGIAMAEILNSKLDTQATAQVTGGAVENIQLIQEGSVKLALTNAASAYRGLNGIAPFTSASDRVRGVFSNLTQGVYQIAVMVDSKIQTVADLEGKRVSLGPAGGLGVELSGYVFEAAGFSIDDVRATYLSYDESMTTMADGNLDAVIIQTALPNPAIRQVEAVGKKIRLISLPEDVIAKVNGDYPYFSRFVIPASMYDMASDTMTLNGTNMLIVDRDLSEEVVYQITAALLDNADLIRSSHPAASAFNLETASEMAIPLHPGAERYYKEKGLL
jgi:hypothetical protein